MSGHVYIIENEFGRVNIGTSKHPEDRIRLIETQSGCALSQQFISDERDTYKRTEKVLHKRFASHRKVGEWFDIDFDKAVEAFYDEPLHYQNEANGNVAGSKPINCRIRLDKVL